jgi:methionyl-tRNA synthetase
MEALEPHRALEAVSQLLATINGFLQERQPWALAKQGDAARGELEATLYTALEGLRITSLLIEPVMPAIAPRLRALLGAHDLPVNLLDATGWGQLPAGATLGPTEPLFPRVDADAYLKEITMDETAPVQPEENLLTIDQFAAIKLVVGIVREAERVPNSKKLVRMMVDLGEPQLRQLVAGIAERYQPEALLGRRIVVVANLKPAKLMGVESRGMLLAASVNGDPFLLSVDGEVPPGTGVR